ncbi:MAG: ribonuclease R [Tidjanibacter sp.]|nr:ribonuclease R [Tidjanibacter sp.]
MSKSKIKSNPKGVAPAEKSHGKSRKRAAQKHDRSAVIAELFRSFPQRKFNLKQLAASSGGADREGRYATKQILADMLAEGVVRQVDATRFTLSTTALPSIEGTVQMLSSGSLYVLVEGMDEDVFVDRRNSARALDGDTVKVVITRRRSRGGPEGEVVEIVRRAERNYVGTVTKTRTHAFVAVDSNKIPVDIFIAEGADRLKDNDKVVVKITSWEDDVKSPTGIIVDILGQTGDNNTEMHAILAEYGLPYTFPEGVEEAAEKIPSTITPKEIEGRRDFRAVTTFTIDPADAKDFDDALSFRRLSEGIYEVGVHIADVTHYVTENTIIEKEAVERATSVYLVDRTIPMLPEKLSNNLCSLRPNEEKLCFSAVFEIDEKCNIRKEWFGRTIIRSDRRFTYDEAQQVIESGNGDCADEILTLNRLAQAMRKARFESGAIAFEREEAKFSLDADGKPTGVYYKEQKEANKLIEEFMLLANRSVAAFVGKKKNAEGQAKTFVYRVHDKPDPDKLSRFSDFIIRFGYTFDAERGKAVSRQMNHLMEQIKGRSEENVISILAVRTMQKAFYSTENIGHYGLAFPYYTHFTSPIRRYPDMMVHRLLARYLGGGSSADKAVFDELCEHSSEREVVAANAERASIKYKMVEYMKDRVGQEFEGVIDGITDWGIYVELNDTHIEGMVSMRDLSDDFYQFDEENYCAVGQRRGRRLTLGDRVRIKVKGADLRLKQLDFDLLGSYNAKGEYLAVEKPAISFETDSRRKYEGTRKPRRR